MKPGHALLAALCALSPALRADETALSGEPLLVPGTFTASDTAAQPVALWLERGHGSLASPAEGNTALSLPAQRPPARACLLLDAPEAQPASLRLRLKLEAASASEAAAENEGNETTTSSASETLEWELAGVPFRLSRAEASGHWRAEYHTAESGWSPLLAPEGGDLATGSGWHTLTLEFSTSASTSAGPRNWCLRWDEREPGPWVAQAHAEPPLLVVSAGTRTAVWLDDLVTTVPAAETPPPANGNDPEAAAAALAARNAALRQEIASALAELTRETGVRRVRLRRPAGATAASSLSARPSQPSGLTVLTPLEERQDSAN